MVTYNTLTDLQLIYFLRKDDEQAFEEIYKRYAEKLTDFASSKLFSLDDAKDIIHDLYVKLWEDRKKLQVDYHLKGYLFKLTRYHIVDRIRRNITREEYAAMVQAFEDYGDTHIEQQITAKELQQTIQYSLDELSPRVKEIYLLSREENLSIEEIAGRLRISEQTVKNQLSAALKHLRQSLATISTAAVILWLLN